MFRKNITSLKKIWQRKNLLIDASTSLNLSKLKPTVKAKTIILLMNTTRKGIGLTQTAIKTAEVLMPAKEVISVKIRRIRREVLFQKYEVYLLCLKSILMLIIE